MPKAKRKTNKHPKIYQFAEYMVSGGAWFVTGYLVFALCDKGLHLSLWWAKLIANITGVTVNFIINRWWVFKGNKPGKDLPEVTGKYLVLTGFQFVVDYFIVATLKNHGLTPYIGQFVSAGIFTVWNWFWYNLWVFAKPKSKRRLKRA